MALHHMARARWTVRHIVEVQRDRYTDRELFEWLKHEDAKGVYDIHTHLFVYCVFFSDPDTAFAFKMRFG